MRKHIHTSKPERMEDLPNKVVIELSWSKDKTTTQITNLETLPAFMLKRLAEDVFAAMPKSNIKVFFLD